MKVERGGYIASMEGEVGYCGVPIVVSCEWVFFEEVSSICLDIIVFVKENTSAKSNLFAERDIGVLLRLGAREPCN